MYTRIVELTKAEHGKHIFWLALILVSLNVLWRSTRYLLNFPLFGDEAFVANSFMVRGFWGFTEGLEHYQIVSLGYLWGTWLVSKLAGQSELALRFLSYVAGIASIFLFAQLAFKLLARKTALLSLAIFCASYYPVRHAAEVKPYSLDMLVSLCLILAAWHFVTDPNRRNLIWWAVASALAAWVSYPSIFISVGSCLAIFIYALVRERPWLWPAVGVGATAALSFVLMYTLVGQAQRAAGVDVLVNLELWSSTFPPWAEPSKFFTWFVHVHLGKMFAYPNGGNNGGSVLTFGLFCLGAGLLWKQRPLKVLILLSPFPLMFIAASLHAYPYGGSARVAQHVAPAICLLAGTGLAFLLRIRPNRPMEKQGLIVLGVFVLVILAGIARDITKPYKELADADNRHVIESLATAAAPGEQWVVFGAWGDTSQGVPDLYHWAGSAARLRYYLLRLAPQRVRWAPRARELEKTNGSRILLLAYHHPFVPFPQPEFDAYLDKLSEEFNVQAPVTYPFREGAEKLIVYELVPKQTKNKRFLTPFSF